MEGSTLHLFRVKKERSKEMEANVSVEMIDVSVSDEEITAIQKDFYAKNLTPLFPGAPVEKVEAIAVKLFEEICQTEEQAMEEMEKENELLAKGEEIPDPTGDAIEALLLECQPEMSEAEMDQSYDKIQSMQEELIEILNNKVDEKRQSAMESLMSDFLKPSTPGGVIVGYGGSIRGPDGKMHDFSSDTKKH